MRRVQQGETPQSQNLVGVRFDLSCLLLRILSNDTDCTLRLQLIPQSPMAARAQPAEAARAAGILCAVRRRGLLLRPTGHGSE
jgi:hypothetical protein